MSSRVSSADNSSGGFFSEKFRGIRFSATAAQTTATLNIALNGMSVAAACEKPIIPTVDGKSKSTQRAISQPPSRSANHANASVANSAHTALGNRALASFSPNNLKDTAAAQ